MKKINVLGTEYKIVFRDYEEDLLFKQNKISGYCDDVEHMICICNLKSIDSYKDETEEYCKKAEKEIIKHEIIHAFLNESGLKESSIISNIGWARNEEMVDFFAIQFNKIMKAFEEAGCL